MNKSVKPTTEKTKKPTTKQIVKGSIAIVLLLLFAIWAGWGWLILLPLVVDFYFFHYIRWGWYKDLRNKKLATACSWIADLLFAVIGVTLLSTYFFQNFAIPSSSLEKSLLVGDYLFVSKLSYGPRVPMTPLAIPLTHNSVTIGGKPHQSYARKPEFKYRRLKGFGQVERGDLVVFNFPAGDTVALSKPNPDYYTLLALHGRETVWGHPEEFGKIVYRPVDRRDHYVKRCVGIPGDNLQIIDNRLYINGKVQEEPAHAQLNYWLVVQSPGFSQAELLKLGISKDDMQAVSIDMAPRELLELHGIDPTLYPGAQLLHMPLTRSMLTALQGDARMLQAVVEQAQGGWMYPLDLDNGWTRDNFGPVWIPKKGSTIPLTEENVALYRRCITAYEGHTLTRGQRGEWELDGVPAEEYTFGYDYYFMLGDNRHNSADSRYWGFVPEDHIVGKPALLWLSLDKDFSLFSGKIRWKRMFRLL